ncbi:tetratricopeptide repeat protein [candidate division GN15 bacterium]|nr:tetratricopeptide repeat protein [candidate division GN15 bacterium]
MNRGIINKLICGLLVIGLMLPAVPVSAQDYIDLVRKGNKAFKQKEYDQALDFYRNAETEIPASAELDYNIGGALHHKQSYEEAIETYERALGTTDPNLEAQAHYNLGNTYFRMGDYQKAIESYQNSLDINPEDMDAKYNLEVARRMLKEHSKPQQQQQQNKQQQQQQQEQQEQQEQKQQEQQEQDQQDQQQQQQQQRPEGEQDEEQQQQQQPQPQEQKEMSQEDAERILNALRDDEREMQEKIKRRMRIRGDYTGKDW